MPKVLVVEDNDLIREAYITSIELSIDDAQVTGVVSIAELKKYLEDQGVPDVFFLDCQVTDGMVYKEFGALMNQYPEIANKLKIFASGIDRADELFTGPEGMDIKYCYFFQKPLDLEIAMDLLNEYIQFYLIRDDWKDNK